MSEDPTVIMFYCEMCDKVLPVVDQTLVAYATDQKCFDGEKYYEANSLSDDGNGWTETGGPVCPHCCDPVKTKRIKQEYAKNIPALHRYLGLDEWKGIPYTDLTEENLFNALL